LVRHPCFPLLLLLLLAALLSSAGLFAVGPEPTKSGAAAGRRTPVSQPAQHISSQRRQTALWKKKKEKG
jgi:hypothetical protein